MRRYLFILAVIALSAVSCVKDPSGRGDISFSAKGDDLTRAMMNDAQLKTAGNRIRVCDHLTGFTGRASWLTADSLYINDEIVYAGNPVWSYTTSRTYPWTSNGTHKFFSWLSYDQALSMTEAQFCGASFNTATKVLSIPQKEMNTTTTQFDFMYSSVVSVPATSHVAGDPVNLPMHHLFTALNLTIQNTSGNTILLKRVTLLGMKNKRSATIDYSGADVAVTTANLDSTAIVLYESADPAGEVFAHRDTILQLANFMEMWPHTYAELSKARFYVEYQIRDSNNELSDELAAYVILDRQSIFSTNSVGMNAGSKYSFNLLFKKSSIDIYTEVLPWEYEAYDWDYSERSISARSYGFKDGVLAFYRDSIKNGVSQGYIIEPTTAEWSAKLMRFKTRNEILKGRFYIESPYSGRWRVTAYPMSAAQYFIITPASGEIDVLTDNGKAEFEVRVNPDLSPSSTQTLFFDVAIYFNGEWHDANSEFNRKNIRLQLNEN